MYQLAAFTPCAPLRLDDGWILANHRGANVVTAARRHTKIQLRFLGAPNAGFFLLFEVQRFEFWADFRYNGMRGNLWVSACLVRDLKPVRWEFVSENRLGAEAIRNRAFHPCLSVGTQR